MVRCRVSLVFCLAILVTTAAGVPRAATEQRFIVRTANTINAAATLQSLCFFLRCTVRYALDPGRNPVFLVTTDAGVNAEAFLSLLSSQAAIAHAEIDQVVTALAATQSEAPPALYDRTLVEFYGSQVWRGYLSQPAVERVRVSYARSCSGLTGRDVTVAVIDTGVDPSHPVLWPVLTGGYDFTRDLTVGSEMRDIDTSASTIESTTVEPEDTSPALVNQSTMAVVDQSTMAVVDDTSLAAFGHGTMVAGVVHLVAPEARIMSLKAFRADGAGYASDILRAIYYATDNGAKVLNMSFSFREPSVELSRTVQFATSRGVLAVASAGNTGAYAPSYPGALPEVIGVASTNDWDLLSTFSNYGEDLFWIAAPGEAIVTTYPFGTYAAAWGTSFSTPLAAGTAALLAQLTPAINQAQTRSAVGEAVPTPGVARGRLDIPRALATQIPEYLCGIQ